MSNRSSLCSNHVSDNISTDSKQRNVTWESPCISHMIRALC
jgi:hypothetical protein